jgi:hypothetical protein
MSDHASTRTGTIGGTLAVILANISSFELVKTALLAAVGTAVSYGMSILLQKITKPYRDKSQEGGRNSKRPPAKQG